MSSGRLSACSRADLRGLLFSSPRPWRSVRVRSSSNGDYSYLDMWNKAVQREREAQEFQRIAANTQANRSSEYKERRAEEKEEKDSSESLEQRTEMFNRLLDVSREERDRIQSLQVIDRAAAAIAAARAVLEEAPPSKLPASIDPASDRSGRLTDWGSREEVGLGIQGLQDGFSVFSQPAISGYQTPGPDFWSWLPPPDSNIESRDADGLQPARKSNSSPNPFGSLMEKEQSVDFLPILFESTLLESKHKPPLPPFQSVLEVEKMDTEKSITDQSSVADKDELDVLYSRHAAEAAEALNRSDEALSHGLNPDGSKWWRETGVERRPDGVVCKWTLTRGVSADKSIEWEDKYWEAADQFDYKELGSEKSGRDAMGNVWREHWKESMWQDLKSGLTHIEKTADKWGKNGKGDEWQEKWWEHYDASGKAEKWAHKWCCIDPNAPLEAGHAHVWHEKWGEKYDGKRGSMKYTDKWAERSEDDGWSKWGDKWDEHFDSNGHGVKQGETWWEGKHGEGWNRTWGEQHNGSGWVHKYGKSSSGEHWDTHVQQDTWYEPYPHYGFELCFENSVQLRAVRRPPQIS